MSDKELSPWQPEDANIPPLPPRHRPAIRDVAYNIRPLGDPESVPPDQTIRISGPMENFWDRERTFTARKLAAALEAWDITTVTAQQLIERMR